MTLEEKKKYLLEGDERKEIVLNEIEALLECPNCKIKGLINSPGGYICPQCSDMVIYEVEIEEEIEKYMTEKIINNSYERVKDNEKLIKKLKKNKWF